MLHRASLFLCFIKKQKTPAGVDLWGAGGARLLLRKSLPFLLAQKVVNKFTAFIRFVVRSNPTGSRHSLCHHI